MARTKDHFYCTNFSQVGANMNSETKKIAKIALPVLLTLIADPLLSIIDTAFVGHISREALGALGVNTAIFALVILSFNFLQTANIPWFV